MRGYLSCNIFLVLLAWSLPFTGHAQGTEAQSEPPAFVVERMMMHTDRQLYISGETIWFKLYAFDARRMTPTNFSRVGYLELISPEGITISQVKVALEHGLGAGTIELPPALSSGSYTLRAYTRAMRNSGEKTFYRSEVLILNPTQPVIREVNDQADASYATGPGQPSMPVAADKYLTIAVQPSQTIYDQRSLVTLEIRTSDANDQPVAAQVSLSIALSPPETTTSSGLYQVNGSTNPVLAPSLSPQIAFPAENHGMLLNGRIVNESTNGGEPEVEVYLAFPGKTALVYGALTDEAGRFTFTLPKLFGLRQIVIQARPKSAAGVTIELDEEFHPVAAATPAPFVLPTAWAPLANAAMVNAQIGQAYQAFELPPVYSVQDRFAGVPFFGQPEARYVLDDYTRFPLTEFFYEVVWEVRVRGKFGEERLKVLNEWESSPEESPPLLLVDGVPVFDERTFLKINNKLIASTEVVTAPFWLNPGFFDGIIQISSFEGDARCFALPKTALRRAYPTLLPQRQLVTPDYAAQADSRLPDFRNTLYWNPAVQTDAKGKATVRFFASDAIGEYLIQVEGLSEEGLLGSGSERIRVRKSTLAGN